MQTANLDLAFLGLTARHNTDTEDVAADGSFLDQLGPEIMVVHPEAVATPELCLTTLTTVLPNLVLPSASLGAPNQNTPNPQFEAVPSLTETSEGGLADLTLAIEVAGPVLPPVADQKAPAPAVLPQGPKAAQVQEYATVDPAQADLATLAPLPFSKMPETQNHVPLVEFQSQNQPANSTRLNVPTIVRPSKALDAPLISMHPENLSLPQTASELAPPDTVLAALPQAAQTLTSTVVLDQSHGATKDQAAIGSAKVDLPLGSRLHLRNEPQIEHKGTQSPGLLHEKPQETAVRLRWEVLSTGKMISKGPAEDQIAQDDSPAPSKPDTVIAAPTLPPTTAQSLPQVAAIAVATSLPADGHTSVDLNLEKTVPPKGPALPMALTSQSELAEAPEANPVLEAAKTPLQDQPLTVSLGSQTSVITQDSSLSADDPRPMRPPDPPSPVQQTAAILAAQKPDQPGHIELTLAPESLGRLHFDMRPEGAATAITLSAERPETLELMRRHLPELMAELKQLGVEAGTLAFGSWSEGRQTPSKLPEPPQTFATELPQAPIAARPHRTNLSVSGGLDLRF